MSRIYDALKRAADQGEAPERPRIVPRPAGRGLGGGVDGVPDAYQRIVQGLRASSGVETSCVIVVVSALPGEGTSTVARNLAKLLAGDAATVLVDANLRAPSQHTAFDVPRERGLTEMLGRSAGFSEVVKPVPSSRLALVTSGATENAGTLLGSDVTRDIVEVLRRNFRWIVFDAPPITALAEGGAWFGLASGVVLVVQASRTRWEAADHAVRIIQESGGRVVGAVLNRRKFYLPEFIYRRT